MESEKWDKDYHSSDDEEFKEGSDVSEESDVPESIESQKVSRAMINSCDSYAEKIISPETKKPVSSFYAHQETIDPGPSVGCHPVSLPIFPSPSAPFIVQKRETLISEETVARVLGTIVEKMNKPVTRKVKFGGETLIIEIDPLHNSRFVRKDSTDGAFKNIHDQMDDALPQTISSLHKSAADWKKYIKTTHMEASLTANGKDDHYLSKRRFLEKAASASHERMKRTRRG